MVDERTIHMGHRVILTKRQKCAVEERLGIVGVLCEDERRYGRLLRHRCLHKLWICLPTKAWSGGLLGTISQTRATFVDMRTMSVTRCIDQRLYNTINPSESTKVDEFQY